MGVPSNTYKTYETVGVREDLKDLIAIISPLETQFYSSLKEIEGGAKSLKVETQTDALAAAGSNAHLEGDDTSPEAIAPTTKLYNMCQIQKKSFRIARSQEKIKKAGRKSEVNYQTVKKTKELSGDVEYAFLRGVRVDGDASTARQMRGALNWIVTNLNKATDAVLNPNGTVTAGTPRALTETILVDTIQNIWTAGGDPALIYAPAKQKRKISGFAGSGNYRTMVEAKTLRASVDVYVSDFGSHNFKTHRIIPSDTMMLSDSKYWGKATFDNLFREKLGKTGDSDAWHIIAEHTLICKSEAAHGRITDLS